MPVIPLDGIPHKHIPIVHTATRKAMEALLRSGDLLDGLPGDQHPFANNIAEAYSTFGGRCWTLARTTFLTGHEGRSLYNVRHVFTTTPRQPWWSLPVRPGERAYEFDRTTGEPIPGSGRPYPHPVLPREIAAIEAERCGPYRDAFGLCTGCGLRGRIQRRCTADDPARSRESLRAPHAQPWKWVPCPHDCGYVGQPEVRPDVLYGLIPQLSPNG
ncbi:hypothetical protein OG772_20250 [Streptomyces sp. NBC_01321]|uniref:hypothetical protein n=1 Tax=Streptomyces sp. NBC_01321 TaxID=2903825 RepID=UPI002E0E60E5|nr:hypothetical protein OG772_20250 [Streptomyces sp. NBC_01321]